MERRYRVRLDELLGDAVVDPAVLRGLLPRLERFLEPFVASLLTPEQCTHARHYVAGLLSELDRKNAEGIAYLHDQERQGRQKFLGQADWDHRPLLSELSRQVADRLGEPDGVLILDPSAFPKKGTASVGVARQWCGRLGKIDNCQVGIYLGYASRVEHALVDCRLYLPKEWAADKTRRQKAGVPKKIRFRTRHELALALLDEHGAVLPHAWVAGDDEMGRSGWFRQQLRQRGERYLLAVPSNTLMRDLAAAEPPYRGRGRRPRVPFVRVQHWCAALAEEVWQTVEVRAGQKGPLLVQAAWGLVQTRHGGRPLDVAEEVVRTGIFKEPIDKRLWIRHLQVEGDGQADLSVHGGADKAVYAYPVENYAYWREQLPGRELPFGIFGENLTLAGLTEEAAHIGDELRIGTARLVITQPRLPCFKLGIRFGDPAIIVRFLSSHRPGFYLAVLEEGQIGAGDRVERVHEDENCLTVTELFRLMVHDKTNTMLMRRALNVRRLPVMLRKKFESRLGDIVPFD